MQSLTHDVSSKAQYRRHAAAWRGFATLRGAFCVGRVRRHESISASSSVESGAIGADDVQQGFHHLRIKLFARLLAEVREHGGA